MPFSKGRNQALAVKTEAVRGVAETTGFTNGVQWEDFSVTTKMESFKDESADGTVGALKNQVISKQWAEGSIKGKGDTNGLLFPISKTFGTATPTTALGATSWAFSVLNNNLLPTFTIITGRGDEGSRRVNGCTSKKITLDFKSDDSTYAIDVVGRSETTTTAITPAFTKQTFTLLGKNTTLAFAATLAGLSSATIIGEVVSATFEFDNSVEAQFFLGSVNPIDTPANGRKATLKATINLNATNSLLAQFEAGTKLAFRLDSNGSNLPVIGTSALRPRIYIDCPPSLIMVDYPIERDSYISYDLSVEIENPELINGLLINSLATNQ